MRTDTGNINKTSGRLKKNLKAFINVFCEKYFSTREANQNYSLPYNVYLITNAMETCRAMC
jgi:hypothetical protein